MNASDQGPGTPRRRSGDGLRLPARAPQDELDAEIQDHLARRAEAFMAAGATEDEAWAQARARFGNVVEVKRQMETVQRKRRRKMRWKNLGDQAAQDLRYGIRALRRRPGSSGVALGMLALGVAATAAVFSVVNAVLLRPLPIPQADQVRWLTVDEQVVRVSPPAVDLLRREADALQAVGAITGSRGALVHGAVPTLLEGWAATPELLDVVGLPMAAGRGLQPGDAVEGAEPVVLLSHGVWTRDFQGDPGVAGSVIRLGNTDRRVAGVLTSDWALGSLAPEFVVPLVLSPEAWASAGGNYLQVLTRLAPGVGGEQARAEVVQLLGDAGVADDETLARAGLHPLDDVLTGVLRAPLFLLLGAVVLVLLIACGNVANLLLAQGASRSRELAVRTALGAGRGRVTRQLLVESLILGTVAAVAALPLAWAGARVLVSLAPVGVPRIDQAGLDPTTFLFTLGLGVGTALLFGVVPALRGGGGDVQAVLKEGTRTMGAGRGDWLRGGLVAAEVAFCLVLLVGAGLLLRSADALSRVDRGFESGVLTGSVALPYDRYPSVDDAVVTFQTLKERMAAVPGVTDVAFTSRAPLAGSNFGLPIARAGDESEVDPNTPQARMRIVSPDYFRAMGIPLRQGAGFRESDDVLGGTAVVINEVLSQALGLGASPVGEQIVAVGSDFRLPDSESYRTFEVVGVVGSTRDEGLRTDPPPEMYFLPRNIPEGPWSWIGRELMLVVATGGDPAALAPALRQAVAEVDPALPLHDLETMEARVAASLALDRMVRLLLVTLGILGSLLAAGGVFGVVSYHVARRVPEIGLRLALGASAPGVQGHVLARTSRPLIVGAVVGVGLALAASRVLESLLFEVSARDPWTLGAATLLVIGMGLAAAWWPAMRASRVDPVEALAAD